jgi:hypothetical protein
MKEYLREAQTTPRDSLAFRQKTRVHEKEKCTNCGKSWKAVKFFSNSGSPLLIGPGRGSSAKHASI